jgi:NOL1/NOP2/sun family putative RNA methylase
MPTTLDRTFPPEFVARYSRIIPDFDAFLAAMRTPLKRTFRVNRLKATPERVLELMADLAPQPLAWYPDGFSIPARDTGAGHGPQGHDPIALGQSGSCPEEARPQVVSKSGGGTRSDSVAESVMSPDFEPASGHEANPDKGIRSDSGRGDTIPNPKAGLGHVPESVMSQIRSSPSLGKRLEHFLGLIYVQEAASMAPPLVLGPQPGERVLDIAAAPGSKTTQMSAMMSNTGIIIANDPSPTRVRALIGNVDRAGCLNVAVCRLDGLGLGRSLTGTCDRVLVDAPCSAEGTIRKSAAMLELWSVDSIMRFPSVQKRLISIGYQSLKPGGVMVYSTCTVAPEENEAVVAWLLQRHPEAELLDIDLPGLAMRPGLDGWEGEAFPTPVQKCRRILPQDNDTEPFFLALVRRPG